MPTGFAAGLDKGYQKERTTSLLTPAQSLGVSGEFRTDLELEDEVPSPLPALSYTQTLVAPGKAQGLGDNSLDRNTLH